MNKNVGRNLSREFDSDLLSLLFHHHLDHSNKMGGVCRSCFELDTIASIIIASARTLLARRPDWNWEGGSVGLRDRTLYVCVSLNSRVSPETLIQCNVSSPFYAMRFGAVLVHCKVVPLRLVLGSINKVFDPPQHCAVHYVFQRGWLSNAKREGRRLSFLCFVGQ